MAIRWRRSSPWGWVRLMVWRRWNRRNQV